MADAVDDLAAEAIALALLEASAEAIDAWPDVESTNALNLAVCAGALYSAVAIRLHQLFETGGYDLGIFGQYAKALAQGHAPTSPYRAKGTDLTQAGPNLFSDHFSPILGVLGPVDRLVPHVEVLLLVQAALTAWSVYVVTRCATKRLGSRSGTAIGAAYALSWGIQQLIGFDFHEVAFALPFISLAIAAYLDGRFRAAAIWAALLLLVKEDMGLTVFVFGVLIGRRDPRTARVLCVLGPLVMVVALSISTSRVGGFSALLAQPYAIFIKLLFPPVKLLTVSMLLLPTAFLMLRSPIALLVVPTLLWRFTADTPSYWGLGFHYSAVLMPIIFLAMVDSLTTPPQRWLAGRRLPQLAMGFAIATCALFPINTLAKPSFWHTPAYARDAQQAVNHIPKNALVAASGDLAPHLVDKATVYPLVTIDAINTLHLSWLAIDTGDPAIATPTGRLLMHQIGDSGFREIFSKGGFVVLVRPQAEESP
ncbi:DUF2079 domain-containing protein [Catenulispora acidiphila]|nr:DUF2079 domain-containing protein [Catenulispora acidiphila]